MNLETKRLQGVKIDHLEAQPTVIRCSPARSDIVALGFANGQVFFLKLSTQETFIFDAHQDSALLKPGEIAPPGMQITDLAWDPKEDNLLVSFADKGMCLITFQGFTS